MDFTMHIDTDYSLQETSDIIRSALEHEKHVAKYKVKRYSTYVRILKQNMASVLVNSEQDSKPDI